jgi:hypothetical protein
MEDAISIYPAIVDVYSSMIGKINALTNHKIKRTGSIRNVEITKVL